MFICIFLNGYVLTPSILRSQLIYDYRKLTISIFLLRFYPPSESPLPPLFPRDIIMKIVLTVGSHNCFKPRSENISRLLNLCCWPFHFFLLNLSTQQRHDRPIQSILLTPKSFLGPTCYFVCYFLPDWGLYPNHAKPNQNTYHPYPEPIVVHCWVYGVLTVCFFLPVPKPSPPNQFL